MLPQDFRITLNEMADVSVAGSDYEKVTSIHIKDPNAAVKPTLDLFVSGQTRLRFERQSVNDFFWIILKNVAEKFNESDILADKDYRMLSDNYSLRPDLTFRIDRTSDKKSQAGAAKLAEFLMQMPDDFVEFGIPGGTISNGKLKLVLNESISTVPHSSRLDPESSSKVLFSVYKSWINDKKITP